MTISVFDLFAVGVGPSSSHSVGPMRAAFRFATDLKSDLKRVTHIKVELYGSLALTGIGHGTHNSIVAGLSGATPESVDIAWYQNCFQSAIDAGVIQLLAMQPVPWIQTSLIFHYDQVLDYHVNGMRFTALGQDDEVLKEQVFFSVGGGFIVEEGEEINNEALDKRPYPFRSSEQLLQMCVEAKAPISEIVRANERVWRTDEQIAEQVATIWGVMNDCIEKGLHTPGTLPGGLNVKRRAAILYERLSAASTKPAMDNTSGMQWLNAYAMAVNEENASGGRIVTAPTNGAAGIIPAVIRFYLKSYPDASLKEVEAFILTAGAIGLLYKMNASISGAEVGCQGEVGVACSMAAGGLTECLGGDVWQVEKAAEIAMEHHLGLTCDPVGGLVQVPCIERNAVAAVRAVNVAQLAIIEGSEHIVSLDKVIKTMYQTGKDMHAIYKETSQGGLAVNVIEC